MVNPYGWTYQKARKQIIATATHCGMCHGPLYPDLRHPHPLSTTVDHRIPRCEGGTHDPTNLQAAHRKCNVRAGASIGGQRLAARRSRHW